MLRIALTGVFITIVTVLTRIPVAKRLGHVGEDIHKSDRRPVPESAGIALLIASCYVLASFVPRYPRLKRYALTILLLGLVGLADDFAGLPPKLKTVLAMLAGIPALFAHPAYLHTPRGTVRAETLFLVAVPVGYGIYANATNMVDAVNSVAVLGTAAIIGLDAIILRLEGSEIFRLAAGFLLIVLAYLPFNVYPARAFNGDVGDFVLGAMIFTIALVSGLEIVTLIASIPIITNGISFVFSVGLKTRGQFPPPTRIESGKIVPNFHPGSPRTLMRMLSSISCGLTEVEAIKLYSFFFAVSAIIAAVVRVIL